MKFYSVRIGKIPGIYLDWKTCSENVIGFKGSIYKSFSTESEALEFLGIKTIVKTFIKDEDNILYVDGGFGKYSNGFGYGSVVNNKGEDMIPKYMFTNFNYLNVTLPVGNRCVILCKFNDVMQQINGAEMFSLIFALKIALTDKKYNIIYSDSSLIIDYWSINRVNRDKFNEDKLKWIDYMISLRKDYEKTGGKIIKCSGAENLADFKTRKH